MRFTIVIAVALLCVGLGVAFLWLSNSAVQPAPQQVSAPTPAPEVATMDVLVARYDIALGTVLAADMIDRQPWPKNLVLEGFVTGDVQGSKLIGMMTRADFKAREPFLLSKLAQAGDGSFLAAMLPGGMRAVTMNVDSISGVAGFLFAGDHVDIMLTHNITQKTATLNGETTIVNVQTPTTSEILLENVKVLAVNDRKPAPPPANDGQAGGAPRQPRVDEVSAPNNVTIELSPDNVAKLRLAEKNGTLSLALRSMQDTPDVQKPVPATIFTLSNVMQNKPVTEDNGVVIVHGVQAVPSSANGAANMGAR